MTLHLLRLHLMQSRPVRRWCALRARAARWLFGTPTTVLEVLNAGLLLTRASEHFPLAARALRRLAERAAPQGQAVLVRSLVEAATADGVLLVVKAWGRRLPEQAAQPWSATATSPGPTPAPGTGTSPEHGTTSSHL